MHDTGSVGGDQDVRQIPSKAQLLVVGQRGQSLTAQGFALDEFEHQEIVALMLYQIVNLANGRMVQA